MPISRRQFIKRGLALLAGLTVAPRLIHYGRIKDVAFADEALGLHKAMYYVNLDEETTQCTLCPHNCVLGDRQRSFCRVRECREGKLYTLVYELLCSIHNDPIEKKPIYHMLPGSRSLSIATAGCNSRCKFCQNWQISQIRPEETTNIKFRVDEVVARAIQGGSRSISYTYSEPNVFYEYMIDTARLAKSKGIKNVWVTGGMINPQPLRELAGYIDAGNIDLKAFDDEYLRNICAQNLKTVLETIEISKDEGMWIEITNLIVPTLNDDFAKIEKMAHWIKDAVGPDVPLHFSRFWPMYKLKNLPPTPVGTLEKARQIALDAGLNYVYIGNIPDHEGANTYCPTCKEPVIGRRGYMITALNLVDTNKCRKCKTPIPGIWQ